MFPPLPHVTVTPETSKRDLALDVVRAWSLLVVVFGHFFMEIIDWSSDIPYTGNTLSSGSNWPFVTWLLQVMPLFFVAGGAVNFGSYARSTGTYNQWIWQRMKRLMKPTSVFLLTMCVVFTILTFTVDTQVTDALVSGVSGPLWFLAVYVLVTALTPITSKWWNKSGGYSILTLFILAVLVDVVRLQVSSAAGVLNLIIIWVMVHQLGYWYIRGVQRNHAIMMIVVGLLNNFALTQVLKWYPTSLVGIPTEPISNMAPPTIVLMFHSIFLFGLFNLLAPKFQVWFARERAFRITTHAGMLAMTIYLWHMSILVLWLSILHRLKLDLPVQLLTAERSDGLRVLIVAPDGFPYWRGFLLSTICFGAILFVVVRNLWPLEFMKLPWFDSEPENLSHSRIRSVIGVLLVSVGL
jgi:peptidoglycan/LPS O-acetylase OafA/YrhL